MPPESANPTHGRRSAGRPVVSPTADPNAGSAEPHVTATQHKLTTPRAPAVRQKAPRQKASLQVTVAVGAVALALVAGLSIAPTQHAQAAQPSADVSMPSQRVLLVDSNVAAPVLSRAVYTTTAGVKTLANGGTNEDWAKLVLLDGGWPQTAANVTVMLRWMRQENGPPDWWNRNNPLNNGYGSGGGSGFGSYATLEDAAMYCALNLQRGYPGIVAGLAAGTSADATAQAIWASPWAASHYGNGSHWSTAPVEIMQAPASAW
ncbi:MAG TPA: hypothetical protein VIJ18_02365 [Microbacteriaceae bacterium]